jgi:hypothetical protein
MFSGFQSNAFQNNAFQILVGQSAQIGGGLGDFTRYRKQLERMLKAAEERDENRYKKESAKLIEEAVEIAQPTVQKIQQPQDVVDINFTPIISELTRLLLYVERVIAIKQQAILDQREEEEAIILLLAIT